MKTYDVFKEYSWLVKTIYKAKKITLAEINEKWRETDRWYMFGHFHRDATTEKPEADYFGIFSLDRIKHIELTDIKFKIHKDFDAKEYFQEYFGVTTGDGTECEHIVLRAFGDQRFYIRDLPWHHSQTEIKKADDYSDFAFTLRPTPDFSTKIVSAANSVKVLSPQWLADEVREMHLDAIKMYDEE